MLVESVLQKYYPDENFDISLLSGGDINDVYSAQSGSRWLVIKMNDKDRFPKMFEKEAIGLQLLGKDNCISVPGIFANGVIESQQYLIMQHIDSGLRNDVFWKRFGEQMADLHRISTDKFGLDHDNYIGTLTQSNKQHDSWSEFIINERFAPLLSKARDDGKITPDEVSKFEKIYPKVTEIWSEEPPALLHGDLWSGNYIPGPDETPYLIDPAVYYGHREIDIGMMHLFGGFDQKLFSAYNEVYPLENGWKNRIPYNQLYPLLVHVNLFGRSYWGSISRIIRTL